MDLVTHDATAPRRTVSLTINADLMAKAKAAGLNVSAVSEAALAAALRERMRAALVVELEAEAQAYEAYVAEHGSFSEAAMAWLAKNPEA